MEPHTTVWIFSITRDTGVKSHHALYIAHGLLCVCAVPTRIIMVCCIDKPISYMVAVEQTAPARTINLCRNCLGITEQNYRSELVSASSSDELLLSLKC